MKKSADYTVEKRKSGRHMVKKRGGGYVNGEEKAKILLEKGLITLSKAAKKEEPAAEEASEASE